MRLSRLLPAARLAFLLMVMSPGVAFAQGWIEFTSRADAFGVNFPGEPQVRETTYTSEYEAVFPARVYTRDSGSSRYSVTVVDYTDAERIHEARAKDCPPDAHTGCTGAPYTGIGSWIVDVRGAIDHAAWQFLQRDARPTFFGWSFVDLVEGRHLQLSNPDRSRTFVAIYMHENRLYILEATVPPGLPEPGLFQQSLQFLDADGKGIRYESIYVNGFPPPRRVR
jgi:hypothetical protein